MFSKYFDIYLCIKYNNNKKYKCFKFDSFEKADEYYKKNYNNVIDKSSTLMPVCSYTPSIFHKYILEYKLSKLFTQIDICKYNSNTDTKNDSSWNDIVPTV
jgi:hypothetical protein